MITPVFSIVGAIPCGCPNLWLLQDLGRHKTRPVIANMASTIIINRFSVHGVSAGLSMPSVAMISFMVSLRLGYCNSEASILPYSGHFFKPVNMELPFPFGEGIDNTKN